MHVCLNRLASKVKLKLSTSGSSGGNLKSGAYSSLMEGQRGVIQSTYPRYSYSVYKVIKINEVNHNYKPGFTCIRYVKLGRFFKFMSRLGNSSL